MNLIDGRVVEAKPDATIIESPFVGRLQAAPAPAVKAGDTVCVALRPEKVRLTHERPANAGENCAAGTVKHIAYLGDMSAYTVSLDTESVMRAAVPNMSRLIERPITWNDRVWLSWSPDAGVVLTR